MKNISSVFVVADTSGALATIPGDYNQAAYNSPRTPDLTASLEFRLTGDNYSVEYDSTGEIYVQFFSSDNVQVSDTILLVRGMTVFVTANYFRVVGVRRSGVCRITAGSADNRLSLTNSPSGLSDVIRQRWPVGTSASVGPSGWITVADYLGFPNSYLSYNPNKTVDMAGAFSGGARRFLSGNPTVGSYYALQFGYVDIQGDTLVRFWPYYDRVIDVTGVGSTSAVDAQAYWRPAIFWVLTASGVTANAATTDLNLINSSSYTFKRTSTQTMLDYT